MKQKAVMFSLIVMIVSLIVLSLFTLTYNQREETRENLNIITALNVVNNRFNTILQDIVFLNKEGNAKIFQERALPFAYDIDKNTLIIYQEFPITQPKIDNFFDIINGFRVFISDTNAETTYTGTIIDLNVARNNQWGGTATKIHFMTKPQCLRYTLHDANTSLFSAAIKANNCSQDFNIFNSIQEYDLNIIITNQTDDYNHISCNFSGFTGCPDLNFSPADTNPYFVFNLDDSNCSSCSFNASEKKIKLHFNPTAINTITISCNPSAGACSSTTPIKIGITSDLNINYGGKKTFNSVLMAKFKQDIESFYYSDYNLTVTKPEYGIIKTSRG